MKKLLCLSVVIVLSMFICQAQQNKSDEYKNRWKIVEQKNESFQNGKIEFDYSYRRKDSTDFITKSYTLFYSKEISYKKKWRNVQKKFNAFDMKDSIQYIYNSDILVTINHKKKTCEIDSSGFAKYYAHFLPRMGNYYLENHTTFFVDSRMNTNNALYKGDNSIIFSYNARPFFGGGMVSKEYRDSIRKILDTEKLPKKKRSELLSKTWRVDYNFYYEFPLHDTVLTFLVEKVEDERSINENTSAEQKSVLTAYNFNNPAYDSNDLYDYRNYSQGYTVTYALSYSQRKQEQQKIVNTVAKAFELPVVGENKTIQLDDYKGKWLLIDFWFISCKPCMTLMPRIEKIYEQYHKKGLEVIGINVDKNDERLQNFVKEKNIPYPTLNCADKSVSKLYNVFGYPTVVLINPQQEIVFIGSSAAIADDLEKFLKKNIK